MRRLLGRQRRKELNDNDNDNAENDENECCPICMESYDRNYSFLCGLSSFGQPMNTKVTLSSCCNHQICSQCLYAHIKSILEEGIMLNGRKILACPFNCGSSITDACVRTSFAQTSRFYGDNTNDDDDGQNQSSLKLKRIVQISTYYLLSSLLQCTTSTFNIITAAFIVPGCLQTQKRIRMIRLTSIYDRLVLKKLQLGNQLLKSAQELQDLNLYERWSLTIALNYHDNIQNQDDNGIGTDEGYNLNGPWHKQDVNYGDEGLSSHDATNQNYNSIRLDNQININANKYNAEQTYIHITKCPSPDCPCLWLTNKPFYDRKIKNERKYSSDPRKYNGKQSLLKKARAYLYYKPIEPEKEEEMMNEHGYTTEHWLNAKDIDLIPACVAITDNKNGRQQISDRRAMINRHVDKGIENDSRVAICPMCKHTFCNLCLQPWHTLNTNNGKHIFHSNITCSYFNGKSISLDEHQHFMDVMNSTNARLCPGCAIRTDRTDGCNHMTCPCGFHWCWVCECRWDSRDHYGCSDSNPLVVKRRQQQNDSCIIS